jgi:hypothetical protein
MMAREITDEAHLCFERDQTPLLVLVARELKDYMLRVRHRHRHLKGPLFLSLFTLCNRPYNPLSYPLTRQLFLLLCYVCQTEMHHLDLNRIFL